MLCVKGGREGRGGLSCVCRYVGNCEFLESFGAVWCCAVCVCVCVCVLSRSLSVVWGFVHVG